MKALLLCAGYATRLYPLTVNQPKHLLPIANRPMLDYTMDKLNELDEIDEIHLVTNEKFYPVFKDWSAKFKTTSGTPKKFFLYNDGTIADETKIGAIGDMKLVIEMKGKMGEGIDDDLMVLAGDNLFEFNLKDFIKFYREKNAPTVAVHDVGDLELMKKYGEVQLDQNQRIISFREKPQEPKTTLAAICVYIFPKEKLYLINTYLSEGNNPDQPGRYIAWLSQREPVYGFVFKEKWYDIGDIRQYRQADEHYRRLKGEKK
ncbi:MAG: nucleotidyltransferase family protein [Elusimicrobiota bacterium]|nr:nucleotidyltransferase family protein [Elusimicrobiota bacterium]